jgi:hypothetical protein
VLDDEVRPVYDGQIDVDELVDHRLQFVPQLVLLAVHDPLADGLLGVVGWVENLQAEIVDEPKSLTSRSFTSVRQS